MKRGWWTSFVLAISLPLLPVAGVCCLLSCAPAAAVSASSVEACHRATEGDDATPLAVKDGGCGEHDQVTGVLPATLARVDGVLSEPPAARLELSPLGADRLGPDHSLVRRPPDFGRFRVLRI